MTEYIELDAVIKMLCEKALAQTTTESAFLYVAVGDMIKRLPRIPAEDMIEVEKANQIIQENKVLKKDNKTLRKYIEQMQTTGKKEGTNADVVEVVRCRNCAIPHNRYTGCPYLNGLVPKGNHFCSYGTKKGKKQ